MEEKLEKKFINTYNIEDWQIETDTGFTDIIALHETVPYQVYIIRFDDGSELECADTHILFTDELKEVFCKDLKPGDHLYGKKQSLEVVEIIKTDRVENMYDFELGNDSNHRYFTNNVLSHNTACSGLAILHQSQFNGSNKDYVIVANKFAQAMEIMDRIRFSYEYLPSWLKWGLVEYNKSNIKFSNKSKIVCRATSADSTRGLSPALIYADEFAFVNPASIQEEFYSAMVPALAATKGRFIISSTPNTAFDMFAKLRAGAERYIDDDGNPLNPRGPGYNGFKELKAIWSDVPGRDEKWAEAQLKKVGSEILFKREYCCEVVGNEDTLINGLFLSQLVEETKFIKPITITNNIRWFKAPKADQNYIVALDPSLGNSGDYAAIQILTFPQMEQVAEWYDNTLRMEYQAHMLIQILRYLTGLVHPDKDVYYTYEANYGEGIRIEFENIGFENIPGILISEKSSGTYVRRGLVTTNKNKRAGCILMKKFIESRKLKINSKDLVKQLSFFNATENSFQASTGHDDLVLAMMLACRVVDKIKFWDDQFIDSVQTEDSQYDEPLNFMIHDYNSF